MLFHQHMDRALRAVAARARAADARDFATLLPRGAPLQPSSGSAGGDGDGGSLWGPGWRRAVNVRFIIRRGYGRGPWWAYLWLLSPHCPL